MVLRFKARLRRSLHKPPRVYGLSALTALTAAAGGLLVAAPGSQALSGQSARPHSRAANPPAGYRRRTASWYYDAGHQTACGFVARHGVANKKLPCGTHVKFWRAGYTVTAVVDDRGPYIAGRTWDLGQSTARALHFQGIGVGYVWAKW